MAKEPELKARDKVVVRMTREGAVEENLTAGTEQRVSKRLEDAPMELALEGDRRWDLIRWGIYLQAMNALGGMDAVSYTHLQLG